jgi:hypothetical protein
VFGYRRNENFVAEQFLYEDTVNWGNHGDRVDAYGFRGCRSVMLAAFRLLFYLGIRQIYLLGCDFYMQNDASNYAFEQARSSASVKGNNRTFEALDVRFRQLLPYFCREGLEVFNCTPSSRLTAFPRCHFDEAVRRALTTFPKRIVTSGMYDRRKSREDSGPSIDLSFRPRKEKSTSYPVANSWTPPQTTLITWVDADSAPVLEESWGTWMKYRPWFTQLLAVVLYDDAFSPGALPARLRASHPRVKFVPCKVRGNRRQRDRWSEKLIQFPAAEVRTPWYLRIDPHVRAVSPSPWLKPEWFSPDDQGRESVFITNTWHSLKPADVLSRLDQWGDTIPALAKHPPLNIPFDPRQGRVTHDAVSSWLFLARTDWTRSIAAYFTDELPCESHDAFVGYCAARRGDRIVRVAMKRFGWTNCVRRGCVGCEEPHPQTQATA